MRDYLASVELAGGVPVEIDADDGEDVATLPERVHGVVLTGGGDVDPALYGRSPHVTTCVVPAARDRFELAVARLCLSSGLPLLAICRGLQVMNVACGGTLVQDIPSELPDALVHQDSITPTTCPHPIDIESGSVLAHCLGLIGPAPAPVPVNSRHHQSVDAPGHGLRITARAPDGVVEALEAAEHPFAIGVQWHPENFVGSGEFRGLFTAHVAAAADWYRRRSG